MTSGYVYPSDKWVTLDATTIAGNLYGIHLGSDRR